MYLESRVLHDEYCSTPPIPSIAPPLLSCSLNVKFPPATKQPDLRIPVPKDPDEEDDVEKDPFTVILEPQFKKTEENLYISGEEPPKRKVTYTDVIVRQRIRDYQRFIYLHSLCCRTTAKQCVPYETLVIDYYSEVTRFLLPF